MLKPTRTTLALATGSLVLGLVGAGAAVADDGPRDQQPPREIVVGGPQNGQPGGYPYDEYATGKVISKGQLKVRSKPTTKSKSVGHVAPNSKVEIYCKENGEKVDGNRLWYRLAEKYDDWENGGDWEKDEDRENGRENGSESGEDRKKRAARPDRAKYDEERWVSARYVKNLTHVKYCH
ncbi:SH3 domain-containing protein [Streptomyces sp. MS1.HAVA.3]|uniref:SH3 domain-containing protein n=1 Tax=Streptomyces caledonius TaxID=3134107 RepID=A0ABU8U057_9ACTN